MSVDSPNSVSDVIVLSPPPSHAGVTPAVWAGRKGWVRAEGLSPPRRGYWRIVGWLPRRPFPPSSSWCRARNLLPTALVRALESGATVREVVAGTVLLRQRAVVDDLVVLVTGRIATLVDFTGAGDLVVETTEQRGRIFGWSGLCEPGRASATVRADADSQVVMLALEPVRHGPPRWTAALCEVVAAGLADRTRELQQRWSGTADAGDDA